MAGRLPEQIQGKGIAFFGVNQLLYRRVLGWVCLVGFFEMAERSEGIKPLWWVLGRCISVSLEKGADPMEVKFAPDVQAKLDRLAADSGRPAGELLEDAVNGLSRNWPLRVNCLTGVTTKWQVEGAGDRW